MAIRNGKARKEVYFTPDEQTEIRLLARRFHIDETSMIRVLLRLGIEAMPLPADNAANRVTPVSDAAIKLRS